MRIAAASLRSPSSADTTPAMISTTTSVAEICSHRIRHGFFPPRSSNSFGPYFSRRRCTSSCDSPVRKSPSKLSRHDL